MKVDTMFASLSLVKLIQPDVLVGLEVADLMVCFLIMFSLMSLKSQVA